VTRLTPAGYEVAVGPAWPLYPSGNVTADTVAMNQAIEAQVNISIEQYYWVHKRFKTRPAGEPPFYEH
jgi:KDO2-lipid IV(A) lauroyltransferase